MGSHIKNPTPAGPVLRTLNLLGQQNPPTSLNSCWLSTQPQISPDRSPPAQPLPQRGLLPSAPPCPWHSPCHGESSSRPWHELVSPASAYLQRAREPWPQEPWRVQSTGAMAAPSSSISKTWSRELLPRTRHSSCGGSLAPPRQISLSVTLCPCRISLPLTDLPSKLEPAWISLPARRGELERAKLLPLLPRLAMCGHICVDRRLRERKA